jgi:gas vesicle protein
MNNKMNKFFKLLLGTSLYLLEQSDRATKKVRDRAAGQFEDLRDVAQEKYETVANRVARASKAIRGEDSSVLRSALCFAAGTGVGIGIGLILAPASGEETRSEIAGRVHQVGDKVRQQFSSKGASATGTTG